jgi:hypothetical protein
MTPACSWRPVADLFRVGSGRCSVAVTLPETVVGLTVMVGGRTTTTRLNVALWLASRSSR